MVFRVARYLRRFQSTAKPFGILPKPVPTQKNNAPELLFPPKLFGKSQVDQQDAPPSRRVLIKNFPQDVTPARVQSFLETVGVFPQDITMRKYSDSNAYAPWAFITMESANESQSLVAQYQEQPLYMHGRRLRLSYPSFSFDPTLSRRSSNVVFVGGLPHGLDILEAWDVFNRDWKGIVRMYGSEGNQKGFLFIDFASVAHAEKMIDHHRKIEPIFFGHRLLRLDYADPMHFILTFQGFNGTPKILGKWLVTWRLKYPGTGFSVNHSSDKETRRLSGFIEFKSMSRARSALEYIQDQVRVNRLLGNFDFKDTWTDSDQQLYNENLPIGNRWMLTHESVAAIQEHQEP